MLHDGQSNVSCRMLGQPQYVVNMSLRTGGLLHPRTVSRALSDRLSAEFMRLTSVWYPACPYGVKAKPRSQIRDH